MQLEWRISILLVLALLLCACQPIIAPVEMAPAEDGSEIPAAQNTLDPALVAEIEAYVTQELDARMVPGAAIGIVKDGELVYAKGFGVKELGGVDPVTPDTNFLVSSVTKTLTAVAVMQLVEQGLIDLDAPVTAYLPYFTLAEPESQQMTIRQLLSHTAGMPDVRDFDAEAQAPDKPTDEGFLEAYLRTYSDASLLYAPGEGWSYSTLGMDVLGDVIAKVSGQSYEQYIEENILGPLEMDGSTIRLAKVDPTQMVTPYRHGEDGPTAMDYISTSQVHAPGNGLFTNVNDIAQFAIVNLNKGEIDGFELLPASAYEMMWTPQTDETPWAEWLGQRFNYYGLGWWVGEDGGHQAIGGYGADNGFCAHMELLPEQGLAVISFVNYMDFDDMVLSASDIGSHVAVMVADFEANH